MRRRTHRQGRWRYEICLRGKAGWGENMALLTAMSNSFGARWFDEKWQPQFDKPEWEGDALHLCRSDEGRRSCRRKLERIQRKPGTVQLRQVRDVDRCHGSGLFRDQPQGFHGRRQGRLCARAECGARQERRLAVGVDLAIPAGSKKVAAAEKFIAWATSKDYTKLVASKDGWATCRPARGLRSIRILNI